MSVDFTRIVADNQSMVFSIAVRFLRDREAAEEFAQDVFLQLYRQIRKIDSAAHATWWLRRAICHRCIDESRKRKLRPRVALENIPEPQAPTRNADFFLNQKLRQLVALLPEKARMIVLLRYQEDLDPAEIGELLGAPVSTIKSQLHRSLAVLRGKLAKDEVSR